jgi:predicted ATPase
VSSLARATGQRPVVWVLEDLHAADLGSLDLLTLLAQPLRAMRALVVATVREGDPRLTDRMVQRIARMARDGIDVRLEPLSALDVAAVAEAAVGRALPAPELVEGALAACRPRSYRSCSIA